MKQLSKLSNNLLATAITATLSLAAGNASALEASIYGVGHVSADSNDNGDTSQGYIASNSSRLGIKGNQALTDNLKILFQYESGVDLTGRGTNDGNGPGTGNNLFTTARDSFAGLGGGWGMVIAGRLPVLNQWVYDYNLFADQVGDLGNIWGGTGLPGRANGVIAYGTPSMGGFKGLLAYVPESGTKDGDSTVLKVDFGSGPFKLGGAYLSLGLGNADPALKTSRTAAAITGSYSGDTFSIGGGWMTESDMNGVPGNDRDTFTVGGSFTFGKTTLKAQYADSSSDVSSDFDASMFAVGLDYAVAKSTTLYVAYSQTDNNTLAEFMANDWGHGQAVAPAAPGEDPSSISVGVVYKFDVNLIK